MYTDEGTARLLARRARHGPWGTHGVFVGAFFKRPKWLEIETMSRTAHPGGGPCTPDKYCIGQSTGHVSWVWATTEQVANMVDEMAEGAPAEPPGTATTRDWLKNTFIRDQWGRMVA